MTDYRKFLFRAAPGADLGAAFLFVAIALALFALVVVAATEPPACDEKCEQIRTYWSACQVSEKCFSQHFKIPVLAGKNVSTTKVPPCDRACQEIVRSR